MSTSDVQFQENQNNDAKFLLEGLISEVEAINDYSYSLNLTENKEIKKILAHIMDEEIEHYNSFLKALRTIDNEFCIAAQKVDKQISSIPQINYNEHFYKKENKLLLSTSIRNALKGELEAIMLYNKFLCEVKSNEIFKIVKKINIDEKEHVEELTKLLVLLDAAKSECDNLCTS